jgi:hypothetical protein
VLAVLTRRLDGNLALAKGAVQDAFVAAAVERDRGGVPARPGACLTVTAWRNALDRLRHDRVARAHASSRAVHPVSYHLEAGARAAGAGRRRGRRPARCYCPRCCCSRRAARRADRRQTGARSARPLALGGCASR